LEDLMGCSQIREEYILPAYVVGLKECCSGTTGGQGYSRPSGWKYVAEDGLGRAFAAEVVPGENCHDFEMASAAECGYSHKILQSIREVDQKLVILPVEDLNYELRWLSMPAIVAEGLWLYSPDENVMSWVNPVLDLPLALRGVPFLPFVDVVRILAQLGRKREAADDEPIYP
jgi:hypothetical protein